MPLIVFSICTLNSKEWALASDEQIRVFHIVSIVTIVVIVIYFLLRLYVNRIAGLCCLKRIIISSIFGVAAILGGIDNHRIIFGGSLALLEAAIVLLRFKL